MVTFKPIKSGLTTRAADGESIDYLFSDIKVIDVTVTKHVYTRARHYQNLKVTFYREEYEEHPNTDYTDDNKHKDKYKISVPPNATSVVWLPAGTYQVTSYIYKKAAFRKSLRSTPEASLREMFSIEDNKTDGRCPCAHPTVAGSRLHQRLHRTESHLGKGSTANWSFTGETNPCRSNLELQQRGRHVGQPARRVAGQQRTRYQPVSRRLRRQRQSARTPSAN